MKTQEIYRRGLRPLITWPEASPTSVAQLVSAAEIRVLQIGCGQGHHLLSLADEMPTGIFHGVEWQPESINRARRRAQEVQFNHVDFFEASIEDFQPNSTYDFILAKGVFSWVPDPEKIALLDRAAKWLKPDGILLMDYNEATPWKQRMRVVEKVHAILTAGAADEISALQLLREVSAADELVIVDEMLAKDVEFLAYDEFAPVMDAWSSQAVEKLAIASGLKKLSLLPQTGTSQSALFYPVASDVINFELPRKKAVSAKEVPLRPTLTDWQRLCVREDLPLVDSDFKPCRFPAAQLRILVEMDGRKTLMELRDYAAKASPELDFTRWINYINERGFLEKYVIN